MSDGTNTILQDPDAHGGGTGGTGGRSTGCAVTGDAGSSKQRQQESP